MFEVVLVRAEEAEVGRVRGQGVAQQGAERPGVLGQGLSRSHRRDGVGAEVGQAQIFAQKPAVGVRVTAHAPCTARRKAAQLGRQMPFGVEQLLGAVAAQPALELSQALGLAGDIGDRHLVGAPGALDLVAAHRRRTGPALGRAQHDHRPPRPRGCGRGAGLGLDAVDRLHGVVEGGRHRLVHAGRLRALDEQGLPAVAPQEARQLVLRDARQDGRVVDLVAIEMKDGQHGAVADRVQELVAVPGGGQRPGFRLAVADHHRDDETGIVEGRAKGVRQAVAKLAAFVDRAGRLRRAVAADAAGEGELQEEALKAVQILAAVRIDLAVGALEVDRREHARRAMPGAGEEDHVEVVFADDPVEVGIDEAQAWTRAPVAEQPALDVLGAQRLVQERIVAQVDHARGEVVARTPEAVRACQLLGRKRGSRDRRLGRAERPRSRQGLVVFRHGRLLRWVKWRQG